MIEIHCTYTNTLEKKLNDLLKTRLPSGFEIKRTSSGKPYIAENPLYFSLSHSGDRALIVLSDKPVGADLEIYRGRERNSVISRWTERERAEILCEKDFLKHWTARESYVKLYGFSLAKMLKRVEFYGGKLLLDGVPQNLLMRCYDFGYGTAAVCAEN